MEKMTQKEIDALIQRRDAVIKKIMAKGPNPALAKEFQAVRRLVQDAIARNC